MIEIFIFTVVTIALIIGTITDLKTREVPDWISYGLMFIGIGTRMIYSIIYKESSMLVYGIFGLGIMVAFGYLMYYTGQWGGGDSKLLMGIGAMIGFRPSFDSLFVVFLVNSLFAGAVYGMGYSIYLAVSHWKLFIRSITKIFYSRKVVLLRAKLRWIVVGIIIISIIFGNFYSAVLSWLLIFLLATVLMTFYILLVIRAVEQSAMYKNVEPSVITEGDWIAKEYFFGKEYLCGPKDLGISKKQISRLIYLYGKKKIGKIKVKYGIPFVPSFLIAFLLAVAFGPWWLLL